MKINKSEIKKLDPCRPCWEWYIENCSEMTDLKRLLYRINENEPEWACWLFTNLMNKKQSVEIAVYSAYLAVEKYEKSFLRPDKRPRNAVEAAEKWLKNPNEENRIKSLVAASLIAQIDIMTAWGVTNCEWTEARISERISAHYAALTAGSKDKYSLTLICNFAALSAFHAVKTKKLQRKIIRKAVEILDRDNES